MDKKTGKRPDKKPDKKAGKMPGNEPESRGKGSPGTQRNNTIRIAALVLVLVVIGIAIIFGTGLLNMSSPVQGKSGITVYYFYGKECPSCHNTTPVVESLRQKYPDVSFQLLEIWHDENNNALYKLKNHELNKPLIGVPEAIVGDVALLGEKEVTTKLESTILAQKKT